MSPAPWVGAVEPLRDPPVAVDAFPVVPDVHRDEVDPRRTERPRDLALRERARLAVGQHDDHAAPVGREEQVRAAGIADRGEGAGDRVHLARRRRLGRECPPHGLLERVRVGGGEEERDAPVGHAREPDRHVGEVVAHADGEVARPVEPGRRAGRGPGLHRARDVHEHHRGRVRADPALVLAGERRLGAGEREQERNRRRGCGPDPRGTRRRVEPERPADPGRPPLGEEPGADRQHRGEREQEPERRQQRHQYPRPGVPPPAPRRPPPLAPAPGFVPGRSPRATSSRRSSSRS